ncbi:protein sidekick-1-like [Delphinapterus leucas]|uniref:Protein sidekick-1-like n=1 Tax=Delphinapterus leucas TaxID=9749 RepID=A0A7F8K4T6_DELLE|nr:protein sidekick-1-like [Delphinapterus leucas]
MNDDVVPYFKTEPGLPQIHLEGNRLVLTCLAEGSWPLEFKWMHNDSELTTYTSEYKYVIPSLQRLDAGFYRCVVRNRMGALLQRRSEVQVAYMGNFMDTDQRKMVSQGHAAVLNLLPITSCPRPQVTWFREGHKIIPSNRMSEQFSPGNGARLNALRRCGLLSGRPYSRAASFLPAEQTA